ncbi:glycosyltransferase [Nesterenkonia sp. Act20]|uniref:glycosyltransferase n=1 Tax=Nesterenkonia sp. Act20 TaxID=1483432 RepID=UPI001C4809BA
MSAAAAPELDTLVVIPAHDEAATVLAAVTAVRAAADHAGALVHLIVVADACSDATAALAREAGAEVLEIDAHNVGAARAAGFRHGLRATAPGPGSLRPGSQTAAPWLATTDADSQVPLDWFSRQSAHRNRGADVVIGTVSLDPRVGKDALGRAWACDYTGKFIAGGHGHIHGANLAFSAESYREVQGFRSLEADEDVDLVHRFRAAGARIATATDMPVLTSRRTNGRVPRGFAQTLAALPA